jgi:hypothetical protein
VREPDGATGTKAARHRATPETVRPEAHLGDEGTRGMSSLKPRRRHGRCLSDLAGTAEGNTPIGCPHGSALMGSRAGSRMAFHQYQSSRKARSSGGGAVTHAGSASIFCCSSTRACFAQAIASSSGVPCIIKSCAYAIAAEDAGSR